MAAAADACKYEIIENSAQVSRRRGQGCHTAAQAAYGFKLPVGTVSRGVQASAEQRALVISNAKLRHGVLTVVAVVQQHSGALVDAVRDEADVARGIAVWLARYRDDFLRF